jgi:flagellar hook-associated protein 3 FlgL
MSQISTNLFFDRAISQMGITKDRLAKTQMQLSSGKELLRPSDAPAEAAAVSRLKSAIQRQQSFTDTINTVRDKLIQQETAVDSANDVLIRIKELTIQAANDTYGAEGRKLINIEIRELRDQLLSLANTQDVNGNYIFSGSRAGKQAFASDGTQPLTYLGDQTVNQVNVGDERTVRDGRAATQPFARTIRTGADGEPQSIGFFEVIQDLSAALESNNMAGIQRAVTEVGDMQFGMSESLASIGASMNTLDTQLSLAEQNTLRLKGTLSQMEDVDYTQAITKMNKDMLSLEAAQSSFAKISQLNLFSFLR